MELIFIFITAGLYNNATQPEQILNVAPDSGYIAIVTILIATLLLLVLTVVSHLCLIMYLAMFLLSW